MRSKLLGVHMKNLLMIAALVMSASAFANHDAKEAEKAAMEACKDHKADKKAMDACVAGKIKEHNEHADHKEAAPAKK